MAAELENFEEDGNEKIGGKGGYPRKLISFGPLLSVGNFAIFLAFSFLFFIFSSYFSSSFGILGGTPPLKILGGHVPPPPIPPPVMSNQHSILPTHWRTNDSTHSYTTNAITSNPSAFNFCIGLLHASLLWIYTQADSKEF